jgi:hypothetical protein
MRSIFDVLIGVIVPFSVIWFIYPIIKTVFGIGKGDDKPKKKKNYRPEINVMRQTPPLRRPISNYDDLKLSVEEYLRNVRDGKPIKRKDTHVGDDGRTYTKSDELGWDVPWYKEGEKKPTPQKKKHFKKGVDPDFL